MAFRRHLNSHVVADLNESCLLSRAHPAEQPGARVLPVPAHGDGGDTQSRSHFAIRVTAEITHFDHSRRPRLQPLQACSAASGSPCCMRFSSRVSCDGGLAAAFCCWPLITWQQYIAMRKRKESRSEEHTSELQSRQYLVCRLLLEKKKQTTRHKYRPVPANTVGVYRCDGSLD